MCGRTSRLKCFYRRQRSKRRLPKTPLHVDSDADLLTKWQSSLITPSTVMSNGNLARPIGNLWIWNSEEHDQTFPCTQTDKHISIHVGTHFTFKLSLTLILSLTLTLMLPLSLTHPPMNAHPYASSSFTEHSFSCSQTFLKVNRGVHAPTQNLVFPSLYYTYGFR